MNPRDFASLANHLWQSTLFAVVAGLLTLALRKNAARVRHWVWLAASYKFLVPISVFIALGSQIHWRTAPQTPVANLSFVVEHVSQPFVFTVSPGDLRAVPRAPDPLPVILLGIWACGFLGIAVAWWARWWRIRAAVRRASPLPLDLPIRVVSSPALMEPGVFGIFRPVLVLPEGIFETLTPAQLAAVIEHELCHVRHRDNLAAVIHMLVETVLWFHPLVWWIGKRMVAERERACDEEVIERGREPRDYAEGILRVCRLYAESRLVCVAGVTGADLKKRIQAILDGRITVRLNRARKALLALAAGLALTCPIAVGIMIGIGNTSAIHAQAAPPLQRDTPTPTAQTAPASPGQSADHRRIALFFDLDVMTHDDQLRAQQATTAFLRQEMHPGDLAAVLASSESRVSVLQDFTANPGLLESAVANIISMSPSTSAAPLLSRLESAVRMLGAIEGKKGLVYLSNRVERLEEARAKDPASLQSVVDAAVRANVVLYVVDTTRLAAAQAPNRLQEAADWQAKAGGKMAFEVASVKPAKIPKVPNFPLDNGNAKAAGGRLSVGLGVSTYIGFAYKLSPARYREMNAHLPKWAQAGFFEIEAEAPGNPTKDQMRLMMQSLLADRFKLVVHFEEKELPVLALTLVESGKTGPKLRSHSDGPPCPDSYIPEAPGPPKAGEVFPPNCGVAPSSFKPDGTSLVASRDSSTEVLAGAVEAYGFMMGEIDQAVVDATGLKGTFDYTIEWNGQFPGRRPSGEAAPPPDPQGITFLQALRQQLGMKLVRSRATTRTIVIDHVERPSEN